jgi:uncharacterized membrane protein
MSTPGWALTAAYWLHMLATVVWIGGLAALALFVLPAAGKTLEAESYAHFLGDLQRRLDPLGWFSLVVLAGTGMFQMSANPNYQGFLAVESRWATAILLKHLLFLGMVMLSAYQTWFLLPQLRRIALRKARESEDGQITQGAGEASRQGELRLMRVNLALGVLILALTAAARAA